MIYKAVKLGKKERKKKIKQSKQELIKFLDLLPPPGQTAPLDSDILQQMLDNFCGYGIKMKIQSLKRQEIGKNCYTA
ncbi:hypothetical protein T03_700 [Trichinella britovi]|uniref:Uncharacterized protein n=1 Tax=Trichinella britovi TaxID=45882 RepID=A0A0V1BFU7_TRIBR|nr:hypothetical protein T03_700 [Trichinella britovi]